MECWGRLHKPQASTQHDMNGVWLLEAPILYGGAGGWDGSRPLAEFPCYPAPPRRPHNDPTPLSLDGVPSRARHKAHQPSPHSRLCDCAQGSYICEFRPWLTGTFGVWITLDGCNITGSPYEVCSRCGVGVLLRGRLAAGRFALGSGSFVRTFGPRAWEYAHQ